MHILVAPDSYKGSLSAGEAAEAMARGILAVFPEARVSRLPIADGGEGLVQTLVEATNGLYRHSVVSGPDMRPVTARWGILGNADTAVVEMAAASGLPLIPAFRRDPATATSRGTGQIIKEILDARIPRLILGIGGSATNDAGVGASAALGVRFLDEQGLPLPEGGAALARLACIDPGGLDPRLADLEILVACDVDNPLCGPVGATAVFGPQKGVAPEQIPVLDAALRRFSEIAAKATGRSVADIPGAGAAGGLGAALLFFTPAVLRPGIEVVLEAIGFAGHLESADLVITGEGLTDAQTARGKAPVGVARAAQAAGKPVVCLSGGLGPGYQDIFLQGVSAAMPVPPLCMTLEECMAAGAPLLEEAAARLCRILKAGLDMGKSPGLAKKENLG
ncbi:MAG: glycerate kinase [Deltaproteobacteria bacterium]|nr:glycerate kinase [Deltaproteobacteria bacterium]